MGSEPNSIAVEPVEVSDSVDLCATFEKQKICTDWHYGLVLIAVGSGGLQISTYGR
jgi:hypothetical protein